MEGTGQIPGREGFALGFLPGTFEGTPARLTGTNAEPFALADGATLTVVVNAEAGETVTFNAADFADIGQATAAEWRVGTTRSWWGSAGGPQWRSVRGSSPTASAALTMPVQAGRAGVGRHS